MQAWQLLPIDLIHYILDFVDPKDFINVCKFIGRIKGKMSQQEQEKSKKYLWKRVESDLDKCLLIKCPGLNRYAPLSVYRKYLDVDVDISPPTNIELSSMDWNLYAVFCNRRDDNSDKLHVDFIEFSFATKGMKISCCWEYFSEFSIKLEDISNSDIESYAMEPKFNLYNFEDVLRPIPRFATFGMFKDEIVAIINKSKIRM